MDPTCMWIIGGLGLTIAAMGGYIVKLHANERETLLEWLRTLQELTNAAGGEEK